MSEGTTEATAAPTTSEPQGQEPAATQAGTQDVNALPQWARDALTKANTEAARYRTQVRDLEPKAQQFAALEEASKTEQQRQAEALEAANRARDEAKADALRFRIAAQHGISSDDLDLLGVGDEEALVTRATRIAEMRAAATSAAAPPQTPSARPVEQLRPGATPSTALSEEDQTYTALFGPQ